MTEEVRHYTTQEIVVEYDVTRCLHVAECVRGLPQVFDTRRRPWVQPQNAPADEIARVILRCPTGALHFRRLDGGTAEMVPPENSIRIDPDGPLYLFGDVEIQASDGEVLLCDTRVALCRCGASQHKPFCDNAHRAAGFTDPGAIGANRLQGEPSEPGGKLTVVPRPNGPLRITGSVEVHGIDGQAVCGQAGSLCRCGSSQAKPFCDGSHRAIGFQAD